MTWYFKYYIVDHSAVYCKCKKVYLYLLCVLCQTVIARQVSVLICSKPMLLMPSSGHTTLCGFSIA